MKLYLSTSLDYCDMEKPGILDAIIDAGYDYVDPSYGYISGWNDGKQQEELRHTRRRLELLEKTGIKFTATHAPFGPLWCLCNDNETLRRQAAERYIAYARMVEDKVKILNIHTNGWDFDPKKDREVAIAQLRKSLKELSAATSMTVAVENLPRTCLGNTAAELLAIIDGINVKVVCDLNHFQQEKTEEAVRKLGGKIVTLHVSDHDGINEKHWLPMQGVNDWNAILEALDDINYEGGFCYETNFHEPKDAYIEADNFRQLIRNYQIYKKEKYDYYS